MSDFVSPPQDGPHFRFRDELKALWHVGRPRRVHLHRSGPESASRHVILLHGWHSTERQMRAWERALQSESLAENTAFWRVTYDTHWKSFRRSARQILHALKSQHENWDNVVLIGYSMGGIVARQMVAYGLDCRALVALCSPHEGALKWSPLRFPLLGDVGASTLTQWSPTLHSLNAHPRDIANRHKYHLLALTYRDRWGEHAYDGIVGRDSALGVHLGEVASRTQLQINYENRWAFFTDPHILGMSPTTLPTMQKRVAQLLQASENAS